jgi:hypothetical protein
VNHIIAGDPAPTNPANAMDDLLAVFAAAEIAPPLAAVIAQGILSRHRAEVLTEAIKAAQCEMTTDGTGHPEDVAYDQGISDAVAAIGSLSEGGESR